MSGDRRYVDVRARTEALAAPLGAEDQVVQSMPDCSPTKWHRAHTTWFFDQFVLGDPDPANQYLWNSYYEAVGARQPRAQRGLLTRPTCDEVAAYRQRIDEAVLAAIGDMAPEQLALLDLGCHHEEQHQELLLMDAKHLLAQNPLRPAYSTTLERRPGGGDERGGWVEHDGGVVEIGHDGRGFAFDNEGPRHDVVLTPYAVADRLVTCGDWLTFIADGGYQRPELWMSDGWATVQAEGWQAPLYWEQDDAGGWLVFTLGGLRALDPVEPVVHVSWYEADAFARWAGCRLPGEHEWEAIAHPLGAEGLEGSFLDPSVLHPRSPGPHRHGAPPRQLFGEVWQWTSSPYGAYPGFEPAAGAVGEYNGKFMVNQFVLRGGSFGTPAGHARTTYRNFFPPSARWAFSGVRLARDEEAPRRRPRGATNRSRSVVTVEVHLDPAAWSEHLAEETARGLADRPPWTPPVWFYDERGSQLFDRITRLPEYYPTRAERSILAARAGEIADLTGASTLVELGSGTSEKTRLLLDALTDAGSLRRFVPFDVSEAPLRAAATELAAEYPSLELHAVVGDFHRHLGSIPGGDRRLVAFLGGTIGNLDPAQRAEFLADVRAILAPGDHLLLGTDLVKDEARLVAAYDDGEGVTAAFNRNALAVMNRDLGADFDPDAYDHVAHWDAERAWIEMRLVARTAQDVHVPSIGAELHLAAGEWLRTEISAKFTAERVAGELQAAGLLVERQWTDEAGDFLLTLAAPTPGA